MRIALSTDARGVTISTTAQLLNVSELNTQPQPLETARVRIESRLLSPGQQNNQNIEIQIAQSLSREDADRLADSVQQLAEEEARAVAMSGDKWRVIVVKTSVEDAEAAVARLEGAGFEATTSFQKPGPDNKTPTRSTTPTFPLSKTNDSKPAPCVSLWKRTCRSSR